MKKFLKKTIVFAIAAIMMLAMAVPAMADAATGGQIQITGLKTGDKVTVRRIATIDDNGNVTFVQGVSEADYTAQDPIGTD